MCTVDVPIPNEVLYDKGISMQEAQSLARRMTALGLYVGNNLSLGYCFQVAGMPEAEFMRFMGTFGVSVFRFDDLSEIEEDYLNA